jgi:iron complex outermembrane recepter protein
MKSWSVGAAKAPLLMAIALGTVAPLTGPAFAQDSSAAPADDEIIVTGEKREVSLQETVTSVSVTTAEDIEALNIVDLEDVLRRTGNAGFQTVGSGRNEQFVLRGVPSQGVTGGGTSAVSTLYIDGAVVPNQAAGAAISNAWDVQQIEVLRGAQSTVQGRNSLIGAIVVRTQEPTFDWDYAGRITYGSHEALEVSAALGGPIVEDALAFRLSLQRQESDGYIDRLDGSPGDAEETTVLRGRLLFAPVGSPFSASLTGIYTDETDGSSLIDGTNPGDFLQNTDILTVTERQLRLFSGELSYEFNANLSLVSLTTYSQLETEEVADFDGLPSLGVPFTALRTDQRDESDISQEFRLVFDTDRLSGLVGALYAVREGDDASRVQQTFPVPPVNLRALGLDTVYQQVTSGATGGLVVRPTPAAAPQTLDSPFLFGSFLPLQSRFTFQPEQTTWSVFADLSFDVSDRLTLQGGFRYENEQANFSASQTNALLEPNDVLAISTGVPGLVGAIQSALQADLTPIVGPSNAAAIAAGGAPVIASFYDDFAAGALFQLTGPNFLTPIALTQNDEYSVFLPRFVARYEFNDQVSLAASAQRAYRAGGLGINPVRGTIYTFEPEFSWNYELALRTQSADGRVTFNANVFLIDWQDQQLEVALSTTAQDTAVLNLGQSQLYGAEAALDWEVSEQLRVFGSVGLLSTEITEDSRTLAQLAGQPSLEGDSFTFAPDLTASLGFTWRSPSGFNTSFDVNHQASSEPLLPNAFATRENESRTLANLRVGYDFGDVSVFAFGSNLFDEVYLANAEAAGGSVVAGEPRIVGVGLQIRR